MKNDSFIARLFRNNKFLLLISLLISFIVWISMGVDTAEEITKMITGIPISINLSDEAIDDGLRIFSGEDTTASISVTGNRVTLGTMTNADVQIVAQQASTILAPGTYTLELSAKKAGVKTNYEFASGVTPSVVTVYVDRLKEITLDVEDQLEYKVEDNYYAATVFSNPQITISGPESEVSKIDKAVVSGNVSGTLTDVKNFEADIVLLDENGKEVQGSLLNLSASTTSVTINVLPTATIPLTVEPVNTTGTAGKYTIEPSEITVAAPLETLEALEETGISVGTLDYSEISNSEKQFSYKIELPSDCKNLSNTTNATVKVNYTSYTTKKVTVTNFEYINLSDDLNASIITTELSVSLIGPESELSSITADKITAVVDLSKNTTATKTENDVTFKFDSSIKNSWIYGKYKANVDITAK